MSNTKTTRKITTHKMNIIPLHREILEQIRANKIIYDENKTYQPTEYYHFAVHFYNTEQIQLAIQCLERGVRDFKPFLLTLWKLYENMQNYSMADVYLNRAIEENVDDALIIKLGRLDNKTSLCAGM